MSEDRAKLDAIKDGILRQVQERRQTIREAARDLERMSVPRATLDRAVFDLEQMLNQNSIVTTSVVDNSTQNNWYHGPIFGGHWEAYAQRWKDSGKPGFDELDRSTTDITGLLADPKGNQKRKGLVMGNVQSGKTGNYAGVIAKAADAGYKLVIVMGGLHNNLRQQTQRRLLNDVFDTRWDPLTGPELDIGSIELAQHRIGPNKLTAAVVKKNVTRLKNLINALNDIPAGTMKRTPVLIIDDEADQATPNSPTKKVEISAINKLMRELWGVVQVGTYLAYTATPFANVLMNPDDDEELFPSDFITLLTPGGTYFGAERVFGVAEAIEDDEQTYSDGLDMVRVIPDAQADALKPPAREHTSFVPPIVSSLEKAIRWFFIATAVRNLRGHVDHSSMLVHTTHYAKPHQAMKGEMDRWLEQERAALPLAAYAQLWEDEAARVPPPEPRLFPTWAEISAKLPQVLSDAHIVVDNGFSDDRLSYAHESPRTVIAIGGGTLSRGLTLEGLVVSYFTRTSNTYDTLMQMGRWFGYRDGYEDLPRIWVAGSLDKDYAFLARVERDLRSEIESMTGGEFTPRQVGVKVRYHPGRLEITSLARMKHAKVAQVSLSGEGRQTFLIDGSREVSEKNQCAAERLLDGRLARDQHGRLIVTGLRTYQIKAFLEEFSAHADQMVLESPEQKKSMLDWLGNYASRSQWTAVVAENTSASGLGTMEIGGHSAHMVSRTPLRHSTEKRLDFKAIMSPSDWVADIRHEVDPVPKTPADRRRARRHYCPDHGLVVLYPISPQSRPGKENSSRMEIPVNHPLLGYAIVFPHIHDSDGSHGTFVSVRSTSPSGGEYDEETLDIPEDTEGGA